MRTLRDQVAAPSVVSAVLLVTFGAAVHAQPAPRPAYQRSLEILKTALQQKDPQERLQAVVACSLAGRDRELLDLLLDHLEDPDVPVRLAVISTLGEWKDPRSIGPLEADLKKDQVPEAVFAEAKALHGMGRKSGTLVLEDVWAKETKASSGILESKMRDTLRQMKTPKSAFLFAVRRGIGFVPVPGLGEGYSALTMLFSESDLSARATALLLLDNEHTAAGKRRLEKALGDDDWTVRAMAAQMISQDNLVDLRDQLVPLLADKNAKVRYRAAAGYIRLTLASARETRPAGVKKTAGR
jgi:HEAT repeat protein